MSLPGKGLKGHGSLIVIDRVSYIRTDVTGNCLCLGCYLVNLCRTLMWCWCNILFRRRVQLPSWQKYNIVVRGL